MKLNRTIKKITSLFFAALMITSVFAGVVTPVVADAVQPVPASITVTPETATLIGHNITFNATVLPEGADQSVIWSVDDTTIGTIDATTGFFIALAAGTTNVIAKSIVNANIIGTATVTVIHPAPIPGNITIRGLRIPETVICTTELATLPIVSREVTMVDVIGRRRNMTVTGPLFDTVLKEKFDINQADLITVRFTALDGYIMDFPQNILQNRDIILAYLINNTALTPHNWPIRVIVPDELAMFWVRQLTTIEIINGTHVPVVSPVDPPVVSPKPVSITVTPETATLNVTENITFTAKVLPESANQNIIWSVDNVTGNGTINATGFFTVVSTGIVNVTARSVVDANIARNATVTVILPAPTAITVSPETRALNVTENVTFIATVLPEGTNQSVTWSVDNETVGTINATGFFTANVTGTANITARSVVDGLS